MVFDFHKKCVFYMVILIVRKVIDSHNIKKIYSMYVKCQ